MTDITDLEYVTEWGSVGDCPLCGEPIEHGQTRATIDPGDGTTAWTHDYCAETQPESNKSKLEGGAGP